MCQLITLVTRKLVIGAMGSTPTDALFLYTGKMRIEYDLKISAIKLYQKLIRLPHSAQ